MTVRSRSKYSSLFVLLSRSSANANILRHVTSKSLMNGTTSTKSATLTPTDLSGNTVQRMPSMSPDRRLEWEIKEQQLAIAQQDARNNMRTLETERRLHADAMTKVIDRAFFHP